MQIFLRDLRYSSRKLLKTPGATLIAIMTLALGIGANTAIFSLIDAVLLRMLPVNAPQQLVFLSNPNRHGVNGGQESGDRRLFAYHEFEWLRDHNQVFSGIFAVDSRIITRSVSIEGGTGGNRADETTPATISRVSGSYFQVLGVSALLGRTFIEEIEIAKNAGPVAVMSYSYWKNRLGRDPNVIGRKLRIDQTTFDIIGIMPPGFFGETVGEAPGIWVPLTALTEKDLLSPPGDVRNKYMWLQVAARLKSGVSLEQAQAGINMGLQQLLHSEAGQLSKAARPEYLNQRIVLAAGGRGASTLRAPFGEPLLILMGLVGLVLAIACANVATLSLARGTTRQKEIAICIALGISRRYLIRQLLTESALLALVGGTAGLLLAQWMDVLLLRLFSSGAGPIPLDLQPDVRMLGFTLGISILTGLLCGLVPAFRAGRVDLQLALKGKTKGFTGSVFQRGRIPVGKILVIGQIALSLILSLVAGLFVQSFQKLARVDLGYDGDHLLQFSLFPKPDDYQGRFDQLQRELIERIRAIPGVRGASVSLSGLFTGMNFDMKVSVEGHLPVPDRQMSAANDYVGPNYFSSIGIPVLVGREIGPQDEGNAPLVGVINQTMARSFFGGSTPIGRRIKAVAEYGTLDFVIVGVVADSQQDSLRAGPASWFYTPFFHASRHPNFTWAINEVRLSGNSAAVAAAIRATVKDAAPLLGTPEIHLVNELAGRTITTERMITQLSGLLSLLALLLACIGLYGLMSYNVASQRSEIGIRLALGARPRDIFRVIAGQGLQLALIGVAIGLIASLALTHLVKNLLYGVSPTDPLTFGLIALLLISVALLACWIPARRATKIDPMITLKCE